MEVFPAHADGALPRKPDADRPVAQDVKATGLTCEYLASPLGIDVPQPRLGWILVSDQRAKTQSAYQILVASTCEQLQKEQADLWDSGKVASASTIGVPYAGKMLSSGMRCWWKVRSWDEAGNPTPWSDISHWEMGLLDPAQWKGKWIGDGKTIPTDAGDFFRDDPAPLLRKEFIADKPIRRARLYISGLGYYQATLNGSPVGDHVLDPAWTSYDKRVLYSTYDVTALLKPGANCLGVMLGNGWYNPLPLKMWGWLNIREHLTVGRPRLIAQLNIDFEDGTTTSVSTDETWQTAPGPVLRNSIYLGEIYDARKEVENWDRPGLDARRWAPVAIVPAPAGRLHAQMLPAIKITGRIQPVKITEPSPGVFLFDVGQNFAGWVRLAMAGPAGTKVKLRFGELLHNDGTLNVMTSVCGQIKKGRENLPDAYPALAYQGDTYILSGRGREQYTPRFTWHGFRYVEVTGLPERPRREDLEGLSLSTAVQEAGQFECSNARFNAIQRMIPWTFRSNLFGVQSDCPHRERFGYGGDIVSSGDAFLLNLDMAAFYDKVVRDFGDEARPCGGMTETAPFVGLTARGLGDKTGPLGWQVAYTFLQRKLYQYYGNRDLLQQQYDTTVKFLEFVRSKAPDSIIKACLGDHETLAPRSTAVTATAFYYDLASTVADIADILGHREQAQTYRALAADIRKAFVAKFLNPDTGQVDNGSQCNQAAAIHYGLVPETQQQAALNLLVKDIVENHKGRLTTGIFGTRYLLRVLSQMDRAEVACTVVNHDDFPGWGYMLRRGATTLWEHWEYSDNTFSHNHPMFGSVSAWFIEDIAGIRADDAAVGFDRIVIRPNPVGDLTWAKASYQSIRGLVVSHWKKDAQRFELAVTVPIGSTATVYMPAKDDKSVTEGTVPAGQAQGVSFLQMQNGRAVYRVQSGSYRFISQ